MTGHFLGCKWSYCKRQKSQRKARDLFHRVKMDLFIWSFVHKNKDLLWPEYISAAFESTRLLAKDCVIGRQILWRTDVCALPHLCIWKRFYVISVHSPTENKVAGNYHKSVQRKLIIHFLRTLKSNGIPILYFSCTLVNLDWNLYQIASCTRHFHWGKKGRKAPSHNIRYNNFISRCNYIECKPATFIQW